MHLTLILYAADDVRHRAQRSSQYSKYFNKSNWNGRKKSLDNKPAIWFQWRYKNKMKEKCSLKNLTVYRARVVIMGTLNQSCAWNAIRMQIGIFSIFYLPFNVCCCCHFALYLLHFFVIFALLHLEQQEIYESNLLRNMSTCRLADPKREPVTKNEMHTNWNIIYTVALGKRTFCWIYFIAGEFIFKFCQIVFFLCVYITVIFCYDHYHGYGCFSCPLFCRSPPILFAHILLYFHRPYVCRNYFIGLTPHNEERKKEKNRLSAFKYLLMENGIVGQCRAIQYRFCCAYKFLGFFICDFHIRFYP